MRNFTNTSMLLLSFWALMLFFPLQSSKAATAPVQPRQQMEQLSKKEYRQRIKQLRKKHKQTLKGMSKKERKAFLKERAGIDQTQFVPNPWFSIGLTLLILGVVFWLIFADIAVISAVAGILALIGIIFLGVWGYGEIRYR